MGELYRDYSLVDLNVSSGDVVYLSDRVVGEGVIVSVLVSALVGGKSVILVSSEGESYWKSKIKEDLDSINTITGKAYKYDTSKIDYVSRLDDALSIIRPSHDSELENTVVLCTTTTYREEMSLRMITLGARFRRYGLVWALAGEGYSLPENINYIKLQNPLTFGEL